MTGEIDADLHRPAQVQHQHILKIHVRFEQIDRAWSFGLDTRQAAMQRIQLAPDDQRVLACRRFCNMRST